MTLLPSTWPGRVSHRLDASGRYPRAVLLVALAGMFATTFPITVLTLAIPTIAEDFGTSQASLAWLVTLPVLASALALPVLGKLGDLYGHRKVFVIGFTVATAATALTATATGPALIIFWRTLGQVAGGSTMPSSLALINSVHRGDARARAMGWWAMVAAGGPVVGLTVGAPVIDALGWQMLFILQAALMVVPVIASWLVLRETPRRADASFDVAGAVALAVGVGPLLLGVNQAPKWGVTSPAVAACVSVGVVALAVFVAIERRVQVPLVPLEFFRHRDVASSLASAYLTGAAYMGGFFIASLLLVEQFGYSLSSAVPLLAIRPAVFAVFSPVGGRLAGRFGSRATAVAGAVSLTIGLTGLAVGSATDTLAVVLGVGFFFQGIGYGLLRPAITTALADAVDERDLGMAGAAERLTGQVGVAFGITILATIYNGDVDRFAPAFAVGAAFAVLGMITSLGMRRRGARTHLDRPAEVPAHLLADDEGTREVASPVVSDVPLPEPVAAEHAAGAPAAASGAAPGCGSRTGP